MLKFGNFVCWVTSESSTTTGLPYSTWGGLLKEKDSEASFPLKSYCCAKHLLGLAIPFAPPLPPFKFLKLQKCGSSGGFFGGETRRTRAWWEGKGSPDTVINACCTRSMTAALCCYRQPAKRVAVAVCFWSAIFVSLLLRKLSISNMFAISVWTLLFLKHYFGVLCVKPLLWLIS